MGGRSARTFLLQGVQAETVDEGLSPSEERKSDEKPGAELRQVEKRKRCLKMVVVINVADE